MTPSLIAAELAGNDALSGALQTEPPASWPPELYERDDLERMRLLLEDPINAGWTAYYLIERGPPPKLVGVAGYAGAPTAAGVVELGYSILPQHRRRGLATEAVGTLVAHAFAHPAVHVVAAETYAALEASIGVLLKSGFRPARPRAGRATLRYELRRSAGRHPDARTP